MTESVKGNLAILALVAFISTLALVAYKIKDVSTSGISGFVAGLNSVLDQFKQPETEKPVMDWFLVAIAGVLLLTVVQLFRLGRK